MTTHTGTVKFFSRLKGYGIIDKDSIRPAVNADIFVHYSAIEGEGYRNLTEGDRVSFNLVDVGKGPQAQRVKRLNGAMPMSDYAQFR